MLRLSKVPATLAPSRASAPKSHSTRTLAARLSLSSARKTQTRANATVATDPYSPKPFDMSSQQQSTPKAADAILELIKNRRSHYPLSKEIAISPARIQDIVRDALLYVPSSFNSQSNRVIVLFGADHEKLWDITTDVLHAMVPEERWQPTAQKMDMFKGAAGTVLFFEDQDVVDEYAGKYPPYADKFPLWATQSDAMLQFTVWTLLSAEGLGANIQHYSPIIDAQVAAQWKVPATWKLNAQLVFGSRTADAPVPTFAPLETRFKTYGAECRYPPEGAVM